MGADQFLLTWNNHRSNFASVFSELRLQGQLVDVTLLCDGGSFPAHRLVLAACSPYFASLFSTLDSSHPLIFLRDVRQAELEALLEFIYRGQVSVANSELGGLIKIAESLRIKGLGDVSQRDPSSPPPSHYPRHSSPVCNSSHHHQSSAAPPPHYTKHKRPASPPPPCPDTFSFSNTSVRSKKTARRSVSSSSNACDEQPPVKATSTAAAAAAGGVFLPDFSALLNAANTYTHGLAASFPALAAVSAAAAEYTARQSQVSAACSRDGDDSKVPSAAEEGHKLRWCLEKGREPQQFSKLKTEKQEINEGSMDVDDDLNSSNEGENNNSSVEEHGSNELPHDGSTATDCPAAVTKPEDTCQLLQQLYQNTSSSAATGADVSSLLTTYQQLITSSTAAAAAAAAAAAGKDSSSDEASSVFPSSGATSQQQQQATSLIPATVQDAASGLAKDAKCLTCQLCGATIKHTANFRRHMKQHLNPRRFPCPWCSAAFGRKDNLKTHTRKHHPSEVEAQEGGVSVSTSSSSNGGGGGAGEGCNIATGEGGKENGDNASYSSPAEEEEEEEEEEGETRREEEHSLVIDEEDEEDEEDGDDD